MKIIDFMNAKNIKNKKLVLDWIAKGFIPGADIENDYVPDSARVPYTKARAKTAIAIYWSIIKGTKKCCHVFPKLYGICDDEFNQYIEQLIKADIILKRVNDNITYYDLTFIGAEKGKKEILALVEACAKGFSEGISTAVLKKIG